MTYEQRDVDRLIVRLLEMKNYPAFQIAREFFGIKTIFDPEETWPIYWDKLGVEDRKRWKEAQRLLREAAMGCLLLPGPVVDTYLVDLGVLEELRLVGFELLCTGNYKQRPVSFTGSTPDEFLIVEGVTT